MSSSVRSAKAATSSVAIGCCQRLRWASWWRSTTRARTDRRWPRTTTGGRCRLKCSSIADSGRSFAVVRRLTTCSRSRRARTLHVDDMLIAFEGLDQSGKQTQAEMLRDRLKRDGYKARLVSFPDYGTSIGEEIARALQGEREYDADVMQLLYIANRYERRSDLERWIAG